ncbi:hypothetical protein PR048_007057, partial [Dryococelus australis]
MYVKTQCHGEALKEGKPEGSLFLSRHSFDSAFHKMNLSIFQLKKDKLVEVAPLLKASALYYKTKLVVYNFTMYNLGTKEVKCFLA